MYSSSSSFLCSSSRFLAQLSLSLQESLVSRVWESRVLSFVPPLYSLLFLYGGRVNIDGNFFFQYYYPPLIIYLCCLDIELFYSLLLQFLRVFFPFFLGIRSPSSDTVIVEQLRSSCADLFVLIVIFVGSCSSIFLSS